LLAAALAALSACATAPVTTAGKRIALTYDDAPREDGPLFSGTERAERLVTALKAARVRQAAFFVTTGHLDNPGGEARLRAFTAAGHVLGNHSNAHTWLRRTSPEAYLADIDVAQGRLAAFDNVRPWFRYPYLDEGRDVVSRDAIRIGLKARALTNAYVTVDTYDWHIDSLVRKARKVDNKIDMAALRTLYLEAIMSAVRFYDQIATGALKRSPAHVLLLHENDMAALFSGDLVKALRAEGWTIVTADEAFADPIANDVPDTLFNGQGRVAAYASLQGKKPTELIDVYQDEEYLEKLFNERVVRD